MQKYIKLLQAALAAAVVYLVLKYLLPVVIPFVISFFLCRLFYPLAQKWAKKTRIPITVWAIVLVGGLASGLLALLGLGIYYGYSHLQELLKNGNKMAVQAEAFWDRLCGCASNLSGVDKHLVRQWGMEHGQKFLENIQKDMPQKLTEFCLSLVSNAGKIVIILFIAFVGTVLLMKNKHRIRAQIKKNIFASEITGIVARIYEVSIVFLECQGIIILVIATILAIGLRLMGNPYGIFIGIMLAFLDALPVLGSGTILLPWALISVFMGYYRQAVILVILYGISTAVREILEPRFMGDRLGINEFYMLMATFIGLALFGVWGILLGPLGMIMILEILRQLW